MRQLRHSGLRRVTWGRLRIRLRSVVGLIGPAEQRTAWARFKPSSGSRSVPRGKTVAEAERFQGIDQHDVQIAGQPAVLKAVVEHDGLQSNSSIASLRRRDAVRVLQVRHVGQPQFQFQCFVVLARLLRRRSRG